MAEVFTRSAAALVTLFLLSSASPASAAVVTQIHWDVTGGTFSSSTGANGPITGGSLDWTPPGGAIATPAGGVTGGTFALTLIGPSGFFHMGSSDAMTVGPSFVTGALPNGAASYNSPTITTYGDYLLLLRNISGGNRSFRYNPATRGGVVCCDALALGIIGSFFVTFNHNFTLGNEVRTFLPEPNPATLLGLALVGLGVGAARRRTQARLRRPA